MIGFKAPGVEADGDVVSKRIGAGEIKIDEPGKLIAEEKYIVREQVGMDDALRQSARPVALQYVELGGDQRLDVAFHLVRALAATVVERPPAGDRQRIVAVHGKIGAGEMQSR